MPDFLPGGQPSGNWSYLSLIKQVLLYLPGVFFLLHCTLIPIYFGVIYFLNPAAVFSPNVMFHLAVWLGIDLLAVLGTWIGLGDIKNRNHLIIPGAVIGVGAVGGLAFGVLNVLGLISGLTPALVMAFFVPALVLPVIAKNWVDSRDSDA